MSTTTAALVWCVIQVTVLTCGVAVVYLAARRVHPRAGAAAAGGGLLMVVVLTALAASPWPRWTFNAADRAGVMRDAVAGDARAQPAVVGESPKAPVQEIAVKPIDATLPATSIWSLLVDAFNRPPRAMGIANESAAEAGAMRWTWLVVSLFAVGGLVAAGRLAWGVTSVRRMAREGRAVDDSRLLAMVNDLRRRLELAGVVDVRESDQLATPATVGWRRPIVLLPPTWRGWTDAELRAVIAHELAHIAGRDYAAWFVARLAVVAHFYHPLVRWLATRLQLEQELAADMAAARVVGDPKQYLHSLAALALATPPHRMTGPARTLFPSRSLLVRRVEMLRTKGTSRPRRGAARYATFAMVAVVGLAAAGLRGPGADLATSALAQSPPDVPANEASKTKPAKPVERIGLEVVPPDAIYVLSGRVAELAAQKDVGPLIRSLVEGRIAPKERANLNSSDIAEVLFAPYGKLNGPQNGRIVFRFVTPALKQQLVDACVADGRLKPTAAAGVWKTDRGQMRDLDALTLVADEPTHSSPLGSNTPENFAALKNALPRWNSTWETRLSEPVLAAVDIRATLKANPELFANLQSAPEAILMQSALPLLTETDWAVFGVTADDKLRLNAVVQSDNEEAAVTVRDTLQAQMVLLRNMANMQSTVERPKEDVAVTPQVALFKWAAEEIGKILGSAAFKVDKDRVEVSLQSSMSTQELAKLALTLLPPIDEAQQAAQQAARRSQSMNNLKNLELAMLNYEATYKVFPAAASYSKRPGRDPQFKHPYSWRVAILPLLGEVKLYEQYHFDEPWDSEANKKVLAQMPDVFRSPFDARNSSNTSYFVFTGPDTVFPAEKDMPILQGGGEPGAEFGEGELRDANDVVQPVDDGRMRITNITDGTSKTFSIVEAKRAVPWTKPEDIEYATDKPAPKLGGWVPGEFLAALVDGSVHRVSSDIDEPTLRAWITRNGREVGQELPRPKGP